MEDKLTTSLVGESVLIKVKTKAGILAQVSPAIMCLAAGQGDDLGR